MAFDLGSAFVWTKGAGSSRAFENNTIYDYGKGSGFVACNEAFCGLTAATIRNNIIFPLNGTNPFDGGTYTKNTNACPTGEACGTGAVVVANTIWQSILSTNAGFLLLAPGASVIDNGTTISTNVVDYLGNARPQGSGYSIGAHER